uniref:Uncharacterized protein n=1 Tax=Ascaris lumbricoides TaxID=6252 RepID=A0A0M3ILW7_ASCLU
MALFVGAERMRTDENDMWLKEGEISEVYEHEEDEFLRELDNMQAQASQRSSLCDEAPVLGALCSLVGEIGELRRENRKLRSRLSAVVEPRRGVVHRVGALLDARSSILPRIMGRRCSQGEIRSGARERLSSPTHKRNLPPLFSVCGKIALRIGTNLCCAVRRCSHDTSFLRT